MIKEKLENWVYGLLSIKETREGVELQNIDNLIDECLTTDKGTLESNINVSGEAYQITITLNKIIDDDP